jgi:hypothetical protein
MRYRSRDGAKGRERVGKEKAMKSSGTAMKSVFQIRYLFTLSVGRKPEAGKPEERHATR